MSTAKKEFHAISKLSAEALGVPGQRTFRILVASGSEAAMLWLEKEQLLQLALALQQLLATFEEASRHGHPDPVAHTEPSTGNLEFKVGSISLGHSPVRHRIVFEVHDIQEPQGGQAALRFWTTLQQAEDFAEEAFKVCAAGRPRCPLCGQPVELAGHICPNSNGHVTFTDL